LCWFWRVSRVQELCQLNCRQKSCLGAGYMGSRFDWVVVQQ